VADHRQAAGGLLLSLAVYAERRRNAAAVE